MKVVYERLFDKIRRLVYEAAQAETRIEKIILSRYEWDRLKLETSELQFYPGLGGDRTAKLFGVIIEVER